MSVFLMGCYDSNRDVWLTVTKVTFIILSTDFSQSTKYIFVKIESQVHTGHDDATLAGLQTSLDMVKIGKDPNLLPKWLRANKVMIPDFVARDPKVRAMFESCIREFSERVQRHGRVRFPGRLNKNEIL